jgi:hypothetical protein
MPGPLRAYQDGSLGQFDGPLMAYADGVVGGPPGGAMPGMLESFRDGSLGRADRARGIRGLGEYFAQNGLGCTSCAGLGRMPRGRPRRRRPRRTLRGLGQDASVVFDMTDPASLREVKGAMALMLPQVTATPEGAQVYTPDWYDNGLWDEAAGSLWFQVVQLLSQELQVAPETLSAGTDSRRYPTTGGLAALANVFLASSSYPPDWVASNIPRLAAYATAPEPKDVVIPYFSLSEKVTEEAGAESAATAGMSKMAMYGLGAAALFAVVLVLKKKKKI